MQKNETKIQKPLSILRQEFMENLVDTINYSGIPLLMVEPIVADVLAQVRRANEDQLKADQEMWAAAQEKED